MNFLYLFGQLVEKIHEFSLRIFFGVCIVHSECDWKSRSELLAVISHRHFEDSRSPLCHRLLQ